MCSKFQALASLPFGGAGGVREVVLRVLQHTRDAAATAGTAAAAASAVRAVEWAAALLHHEAGSLAAETAEHAVLLCRELMLGGHVDAVRLLLVEVRSAGPTNPGP